MNLLVYIIYLLLQLFGNCFLLGDLQWRSTEFVWKTPEWETGGILQHRLQEHVVFLVMKLRYFVTTGDRKTGCGRVCQTPPWLCRAQCWWHGLSHGSGPEKTVSRRSSGFRWSLFYLVNLILFLQFDMYQGLSVPQMWMNTAPVLIPFSPTPVNAVRWAWTEVVHVDKLHLVDLAVGKIQSFTGEAIDGCSANLCLLQLMFRALLPYFRLSAC